MKTRISFALCSLFLSSLSLSLAESGWPNWRGPNADGTSSDAKPPTEWSATKNVRWKTAIPGKGSSTPIVLGDRIFLTTAVDTRKKPDGSPVAERASAPPTDRRDRRRRRGSGGRPGGGGGGGGGAPESTHEFRVICLDRKSGDILWNRKVNALVPHSGHHHDHGYASASAITDGTHVWAHFGSRGTFCLAAKDGEQVWSRTDLGKMTTRGGFGDGSTPALHGDLLVVPWDHEGESYITALHKKTGKTAWKTERDHPSSWTTPLIVSHKGANQVVQSGEGFAVAYALADGKEIWRADGQTSRPVATPVSAEGMVYIGSGFRGSFLGAYKLDGAKGDITDSKNVAWTITSDTPDIASFLLSGGRLYFHSGKDGIVTCVDAKTGKSHYSRERIGLGRVYASPVAANGHVYFTDRDGKTVVLKDAPKLEVVATNELGEPVDATPALAGREIFIRSHKHLYCIAE